MKGNLNINLIKLAGVNIVQEENQEQEQIHQKSKIHKELKQILHLKFL